MYCISVLPRPLSLDDLDAFLVVIKPLSYKTTTLYKWPLAQRTVQELKWAVNSNKCTVARCNYEPCIWGHLIKDGYL